jgi:ATP-binding cassette subfamily B protein
VSLLSNNLPDAWQKLPEALRHRAEAELRPGEQMLAWLEPDLDTKLNFARGLVLLTDQRLVALDFRAAASAPRGDGQEAVECRAWPLAPGIALRTREEGGAATLELLDQRGRLAHWRFTAGRVAAAHRLVERFKAREEGAPAAENGEAGEAESLCQACGLPIPPESHLCSACAAALATRPAQTLFRLLPFARARAGMIVLGFGLSLAATAASLIMVYLQKPVIDNILTSFQPPGGWRLGALPWYLSAMAAAATLTFFLAWGRNYVLAWVSERIAADLRNVTYTHLQRLSLEFFGGKRTGDLIARVSSDTEKINIFLSVHLLDFANDVLMILMTAAMMLAMDWRLAVVTLCPLPLIAWLVQRVRRRLRAGFQLGSRAWAEMTSVLADSIPGIRVVKAFAQEQREIERFHRSNDHVLQAADRVNRTWAFFSPVVQWLNDVGLLVIWVFAVWQIYRLPADTTLAGLSRDVGNLWVFVIYAGRFYGRLEAMSRIVSAVQRAAAATQRVFGILDRQATVAEPLHPVHPVALKGQIEFRDVAFRYGNRTVVEGINLVIRPGEMIGLVGASGAGKTTLVNLVCRFYDVAEGAVLVDGTDVRAFPVEEYRRHIGLVLQEPFLFYGTIAENIAYGRPAARPEEIVAAARAARAHEFILRLPDGYDSLVGERGQTLSGGERQRISIARAILINPRLLILDEATSSVDTETEREIQVALENLIRGRTTIAIAHRLSTLARADRLMVLDRGRIVEIGPHDELLRAGRTYARLYRAQSAMAKDGAA